MLDGWQPARSSTVGLSTTRRRFTLAPSGTERAPLCPLQDGGAIVARDASTLSLNRTSILSCGAVFVRAARAAPTHRSAAGRSCQWDEGPKPSLTPLGP
jgi:hypothetical protein